MPIGCILWIILLFILATDKTEWRPTIIGAIIVIIAAMIIVSTQKCDINFPDELKKDKDNNDKKTMNHDNNDVKRGICGEILEIHADSFHV